jgi:hypothetical protein
MKENLKKGVRKKKSKLISMLSDSLLIRHKKTKIEYTISKILFKDGKPIIYAYRYYSNAKGNKRVHIKIEMNEFNKYETV